MHVRTSRTRVRMMVGVATLLALVGTATGQTTGQAAAPGGPDAMSGADRGSRAGELGIEQGGPRRGAIDPRFATPAAARTTVHDAHHAGGGDDMVMGDDPSDASASQVEASGSDPAPGEETLDPAVFGSWESTSYNLPVRAIHASLLRTGKVLLMAGSGNQLSQFQAGSFKAGLLDPVAGTYRAIDPPYDMFCAGHAQLPNGNILIVGGTAAYPTDTDDWKGVRTVFEFDVTHEQWIARRDMAHGRWYPTSVESPSGNIYNFAGQNENGHRNKQVERYSVSSRAIVLKPNWDLPDYPGLFWTAKNRVFYAGTRTRGEVGQPGLYNPSTGALQPVDGITELEQRNSAATILAGNAKSQRVLVLGGGWPATASTSYVDLRPATPTGVAGPDLATAKAYVGAVNLPTDGSVFETGGGTGRDTPVFESSVIRGNTVMPMAPNTVGRTYHSSTLLLPDGRVMTMGGDPTGDAFEMRVEIFSPPYLHNGTRPRITAAPKSVRYRTAYKLSAKASHATLTSAWLVRPSSTTHSLDPNQRAVRLRTRAVAHGLKFKTPDKFLAPPGYYMLFVNDSHGRPSVARWVKIH